MMLNNIISFLIIIFLFTKYLPILMGENGRSFKEEATKTKNSGFFKVFTIYYLIIILFNTLHIFLINSLRKTGTSIPVSKIEEFGILISSYSYYLFQLIFMMLLLAMIKSSLLFLEESS